MRQLVARLILATAAAVIVAVTATALALHLLDDRARARADAEAELSALVTLAEVSTEEEDLRRGIGRSDAGRAGRLAVHLPDGTVGSSRLPAPAGGEADAQLPTELAVDGGTVLLRRVGDGFPGAGSVVEVFLPAAAATGAELGRAVLLLAAGAGAAAIGTVIAVRRLRPVVDDLDGLTGTARALGQQAPLDDEDAPAADAEPRAEDELVPGDEPEEPPAEHDRPPPARAMHSPETVAMAAALDALADRLAEARVHEDRVAADVSHRLRTPLTALRLDADGLGPGPAADQVRSGIDALNRMIDELIRAPNRETRPRRCDVAAVVGKRMEFWTPLAEHHRRRCEFRTVAPPATTALAEDELGAVVDALMNNIFNYTPPETAIAVSVVRHAGWITLVVDDAGPGVVDPVAVLDRGVSGSGSTGLGLDIARDAVEATGGTIHVERAALGGARIRLRFGEVGVEHADKPLAWRLLPRGER